MHQRTGFPDKNTFNSLSETKKIETLLEAASFAPSTVNTQPWLFKVQGNVIELYMDTQRKLPVSDPLGRQAYISLGACWKNLVLSLESYGLAYTAEELLPAEENKPVASITIQDFIAKKHDEKTTTAIKDRHTNRFPFDHSGIPSQLIDKIKQYSSNDTEINLIEDDLKKNTITPIVLDAVFETFSRKDWLKELSHWIKPSLDKYEDGMPGYYLGIPKLISFILPFILRHGNVAKKQKEIHKTMLAWVPAYGVITTSENNPRHWFRVGEKFEDIAIEAEKFGIKIGILTAPIEIESQSQKLQLAIGTKQIPQMFFRIGYTSKTPIFSPRLPIQKIIKPHYEHQ
jgi:hypothetical protein